MPIASPTSRLRLLAPPHYPLALSSANLQSRCVCAAPCCLARWSGTRSNLRAGARGSAFTRATCSSWRTRRRRRSIAAPRRNSSSSVPPRTTSSPHSHTRCARRSMASSGCFRSRSAAPIGQSCASCSTRPRPRARCSWAFLTRRSISRSLRRGWCSSAATTCHCPSCRATALRSFAPPPAPKTSRCSCRSTKPSRRRAIAWATSGGCSNSSSIC
mmetsp:Transcript_24943/g.58108  ORF Transcript_24943/g.58108 Transcript_24943/m.58108 type:complete len:215 (-) Transcript_24943:1105-1749(-)